MVIGIVFTLTLIVPVYTFTGTDPFLVTPKILFSDTAFTPYVARCSLLFRLSVPNRDSTKWCGFSSLVTEYFEEDYILLESSCLSIQTVEDTSIYTLFAVDYTGKLNWQCTLGDIDYIDPQNLALTDINRDNINDLIILSNISTINNDPFGYSETYIGLFSIIDGATQKIISKSTISLPSFLLPLVSPESFDVNGDGYSDLALTLVNNYIAMVTPTTGKIIWCQKLSNETDSDDVSWVCSEYYRPRLIDINQDKKFVIFAFYNEYIICLDASSGNILWSIKTDSSFKFWGNPIFEDCNRDGKLDIIITEVKYSYNNNNIISVSVFNCADGKLIWHKVLGTFFTSSRPRLSFFIFGDIPVIFVAVNNYIFLMEGKHGFVIDQTTLPFFITSVKVAQKNSNSPPEVILSGITFGFGVKRKRGIFSISISKSGKKLYLNRETDELFIKHSYFMSSVSLSKQIYEADVPQLNPKWYHLFISPEQKYKDFFINDNDIIVLISSRASRTFWDANIFKIILTRRERKQ